MTTTFISSRILVPRDPLQDIVLRTLNRIDSVHAVSNMPVTPLAITESTQFGGYVPEREEEVRHFELSRLGPHLELSLTHEIGHFLDHALGDFDIYASGEDASALTHVMQVIAQSHAVREMRAYLQSNIQMPMSVRFQLLYWLSPQELWARTYAQYIAVRSADDHLLRELDIDRSLEGPDVFRNSQWEANDFLPIAAAIDTAFTRMGWKV